MSLFVLRGETGTGLFFTSKGRDEVLQRDLQPFDRLADKIGLYVDGPAGGYANRSTKFKAGSRDRFPDST